MLITRKDGLNCLLPKLCVIIVGCYHVRRQLQQARQRRLRAQRRRVVLALLLIAKVYESRSTRRWWVRPRSTHFAYSLRSGLVLRGREFLEAFRMSHRSFRALYDLLG